MICPDCNGEREFAAGPSRGGFTDTVPCLTCNATGEVPDEEASAAA